jgi:hypothetical protein
MQKHFVIKTGFWLVKKERGGEADNPGPEEVRRRLRGKQAQVKHENVEIIND